MATERNKIKATAQVWIRLEKYASAESISLQEVQLGPFGPPVKMQTGRCLHFLSFFFFFLTSELCKSYSNERRGLL